MYLVVGGNGYLGRYFIKNILERTTDVIIATYSRGEKPIFENPRLSWMKLDVRDVGGVCALNEHLDEGTKAIYLAAYHHPDKVEENPALAWDINITALANAVNSLTRLSCLYYASTDTVYGEGNKDKKFIESDICAPVNRYGKHKVLAEQIVLAAGYNVIRYPFIFGPSIIDGRPHFFDIIRANLEAGKIVEMFMDSYRSTLSFEQCTRYLVELIETYGNDVDKILNIASDTPMSKYEAALALAERFHLDKSLIHPISVRQGGAIFKTKRAETAILDNTRIKQLLHLEAINLEL